MSATISSRTPEGLPNHCPVCDDLICIEPSHPPGDAPCPRCGTLLWFFETSHGMRFHESKAVAPIRDWVLHTLCEALGVNKQRVSSASSFSEEVGADSLDIVELVMELESEFDITVPPEEAEEIRTIGDIIDYVAKRIL